MEAPYTAPAFCAYFQESFASGTVRFADSIALALAAGVPQIICPIMGEQFDLGNRVQRLGVGKMIGEEPMAPARLARVIESLINAERVSKACRRWQARVDRREGLTKAADSIEALPRFVQALGTPSPGARSGE